MQSILQIRSRLRIPLFGLLLLGLQNRHSPFSVHVSYCQDNSESGSGTDDFTRAKKRLVDKTQRFISSFDEQVKNMNVYESISTFVSSDTPVLLSYGFFMGYTCGFCVKKTAKVAAFIVGGVFITIQLLSNHERVPIDYNKLQVQLEQVLGVRIESIDDMRIKYQHLRPELQEKIRTIGGMGGNSVSSGCGFTAGLIIGLKS